MERHGVQACWTRLCHDGMLTYKVEDGRVELPLEPRSARAVHGEATWPEGFGGSQSDEGGQVQRWWRSVRGFVSEPRGR